MKLAGKRRITQLEQIYPYSQRQSLPLLAESITLGHSRGNRIVVRDSTVSRRHAQIKLVNGIWQIEDLDSTNGTRMNGEYIKGPRRLRDSDRIALGKIWFRFSQQPVTGPPASHHLGLLTPQKFEELIAELLAAEGFTNVMVTGRPGDGGIDIAASSDRPFSQGRYVVQCKRYYNQRVTPLEVQAFHGTITADPAARGSFVTTSSFTRGARRFAAGVGMGLVDGEQLVILLTHHNLWPF